MYAVIRSFPQMKNVEEAGRLAETGREVILRGELYRDRLGLLEFVTEEALRAALVADPDGAP